jgi:hypothetical protein
VKPVNTQDLLRQIEALLINHQDQKARTAKPNGLKQPLTEERNRSGSAKKAV